MELPETELRKQHAQDLRTIIGHNGIELPDDLYHIPDVNRDQRFDDKYGRMAEKLYSGFVDMAAKTRDERAIALSKRLSILHGSYVLTRILSRGPAAYAAYLEDNPEPESPMQELENSMRRGNKVVRFFAERDAHTNTLLEVNFGLLQFESAYEKLPFAIGPDDTGELVFGLSPASEKQAMIDMTGYALQERKPLPGDKPEQSCPAVGRVMTAFWNAGIDIGVSDPAFFEADLAEARNLVAQPTEAQL